ncbi:MAG TPA: hypothetical protein VK668_17975 [Mucilaginibacter sp.]|nr:hypothetical protein [Mucilaginibacter sp.]
MSRLTAFRLFLSLAALLFVAKPFIGFVAFNRQSQPRQVHSILVKSFSKRKPESLEEADANVEFIHKLLSNPFLVLQSAISFLLLTMFPAVFKSSIRITGETLSSLRYTLLPPEHAYLLTGKLII